MTSPAKVCSASFACSAAFVATFKDPAFNEFLEKQSVVSATTTPAGFAAFLQEDRKAAEELIKLANSKRETYKAE